MMEAKYKGKWDALRLVYERVLDQGPIIQYTAYTPHDYSRHCTGIYRNIGIFFIDIIKKVVTQEELFILNVSVLLHDIKMAYDSSPEMRNAHGQSAKEFILDEVYKQKSSTLSDLLTKPQTLAIVDVILGHSDIKSETRINTIDLLPLDAEFLIGELGKPINVRLLAAILRFADELDITSARIEGIKIDRYPINEDSEKFWRQCELFVSVRKNPTDNRQIVLQVDSTAVHTKGDKENDIPLIIEVRNKISEELNMLNNKVFSKQDYGWLLQEVVVKADAEIEELIKNQDTANPLGNLGVVEAVKKKELI
jgi:hypothetical protein